MFIKALLMLPELARIFFSLVMQYKEDGDYITYKETSGYIYFKRGS